MKRATTTICRPQGAKMMSQRKALADGHLVDERLQLLGSEVADLGVAVGVERTLALVLPISSWRSGPAHLVPREQRRVACRAVIVRLGRGGVQRVDDPVVALRRGRSSSSRGEPECPTGGLPGNWHADQ
jgi:hypothetical protein